jgi:hypothetical protein
MIKPILIDQVEKVDRLDIDQIEIVTDSSDPLKVELYILDSRGNRVEGGGFNRSAFLDCILNFYKQNF